MKTFDASIYDENGREAPLKNIPQDKLLQLILDCLHEAKGKACAFVLDDPSLLASAFYSSQRDLLLFRREEDEGAWRESLQSLVEDCPTRSLWYFPHETLAIREALR